MRPSCRSRWSPIPISGCTRSSGAESARRARLDPRARLPIVRAVLLSLWAIVRARQPAPPLNPQGGRFGLPADFLIASDGRVLACKYGAHVYDQWSVDELLALAGSKSSASSSSVRAAERAKPGRRIRI
jgi:hypothetical protein